MSGLGVDLLRITTLTYRFTSTQYFFYASNDHLALAVGSSLVKVAGLRVDRLSGWVTQVLKERLQVLAGVRISA